MSENGTDFVRWIWDQMHERGWTQADVVRSSGVNSGLLSRILSGHRMPTAETAVQVARGFGLPGEEGLRAIGLLPALPARGSAPLQLSEIARLLSAEDQALLLRVARSLVIATQQKSARPMPDASEENDMSDQRERKELLDAIKDLPKEIVEEIVRQAKALKEELERAKRESAKRPSELREVAPDGGHVPCGGMQLQ